MSEPHSPRGLLGATGLWTIQLEGLPSSALRETVQEIEALGWPALWIPETFGREALSASALLLSATERLVVVTGIATIWGRDPSTAAMGHRTLTEAFPERFAFGLGISHPNLVGARGHTWAKPVTAMREYLDTMDMIQYRSVQPTTAMYRLLAALQPRMLALSAEKAAGVHTYLVTPEHTATAREILGPNPVLAPEQMVILQDDPAEARRIARLYLAPYLAQPNYQNSLRRLGFTDDDFEGGGTDGLIDALVAWGAEDAILKRIQAHHDAGADHVCVQPVADPTQGFPIASIRRLSEALLPT